MKDIKKEKWDESYSRKENYIFYPKEEVVKFLNRFIRKRTGFNNFFDILKYDSKLRGLDLGCGIGRQTILIEEFGIDGYGVDISSKALEEAVALSAHLGYNIKDRFTLINDTILPFDNNFFDFAISDSVLDSMDYTFAKQYMAELDRTVKKHVYLNLISNKSISNFETSAKDILVEDAHEHGTIQSYYTKERIEDLIKDTSFKIIQLNINTEKNLIKNQTSVRFHVVLSK
jgi:SAM-dependent methyltransferase